MKYAAPSSVEEATSLLSSSPSAQVFAGATDVVPQIRAGRPVPDVLVDLKKIDELVSLTNDAEKWTVGAAIPTVRLTEDAAFSGEFPGLSEAAGLIGSDQIQSRSSLGGNLCNASPAADSVPALIAAGAVCVVVGPSGQRELPVEAVVTGPGPPGLAPGARRRGRRHGRRAHRDQLFLGASQHRVLGGRDGSQEPRIAGAELLLVTEFEHVSLHCRQ